jgi:hypothetical protein
VACSPQPAMMGPSRSGNSRPSPNIKASAYIAEPMACNVP